MSLSRKKSRATETHNEIKNAAVSFLDIMPISPFNGPIFDIFNDKNILFVDMFLLTAYFKYRYFIPLEYVCLLL